MRKALTLFLALVLMLGIMVTPAFAATDDSNYSYSYAQQKGVTQAGYGSWKWYDNVGWRFVHSYDNTYYVNCWEKIGNNWYYLAADGHRLQSEYAPDGYWLNENGVRTINNKYGPNNGTAPASCSPNNATASWTEPRDVPAAPNTPVPPSLRTGWEQTGGYWYYYKDGVKQTGWIEWQEQHYWLNSYGRMVTGWQRVSGAEYYFSPATESLGQRVTGWQKIGSSWYYFAPETGIMQTGWLYWNGNWYWLNSSGQMATGWQTISGTRYYFSTDTASLGILQNYNGNNNVGPH